MGAASRARLLLAQSDHSAASCLRRPAVWAVLQPFADSWCSDRLPQRTWMAVESSPKRATSQPICGRSLGACGGLVCVSAEDQRTSDQTPEAASGQRPSRRACASGPGLSHFPEPGGHWMSEEVAGEGWRVEGEDMPGSHAMG